MSTPNKNNLTNRLARYRQITISAISLKTEERAAKC